MLETSCRGTLPSRAGTTGSSATSAGSDGMGYKVNQGMMRQLLEHAVRKDLRRGNKRHNHTQFLRALAPVPRIGYWAGYHKKKLIFLVVLGVVAWTYDWYKAAYRSLRSLQSPQQFIHRLATAEEKVPKTITEQSMVWQFDPQAKQLLERLYFQADRKLIFGVSRNYLFQIYKELGLLQKPEDERTFWVNGGFYRKRNQLVSGVGLTEFLQLYEEAFNFLKKTQPDLTEESFRQNFASLFVAKAKEIVEWQKAFNKKRHNEYLKSLLTDNDAKQDEICRLMRENLDIREEEVEKALEDMGMKGLSVRDKWLYWRNREVLLALRQETLQRRLTFGILDVGQQREIRKRMQKMEKQLEEVKAQQENIKLMHKQLYDGEQLLPLPSPTAP